MHVQSQFVCLHIHNIHADRNIIYTHTNIYYYSITYKYNTCTCKHTTCTCKYNTCTNKYKTYIIWIYMNMLIWICVCMNTHTFPQNLCALEPASLACFTMVMASSTRPTFLDTLELPLVFVHLCPPLCWTWCFMIDLWLFGVIVWICATTRCMHICMYNMCIILYFWKLGTPNLIVYHWMVGHPKNKSHPISFNLYNHVGFISKRITYQHRVLLASCHIATHPHPSSSTLLSTTSLTENLQKSRVQKAIKKGKTWKKMCPVNLDPNEQKNG